MPENNAVEFKIIKAKEELKVLVKNKFSKPLNSLKSFKELSELTKLSSQTLRRFFGKIELENKTSTTTLSLLCQFVGYQDWENFQKEYKSHHQVSIYDKALIENMSVFFKNGNKYNTDYFQKTSTVDTLNDYARTIYASKENVKYFYKLYKTNNWATDYILAWLPNYNYFGQDWFRKILLDKSERTMLSCVRLSQSCFLHFGAFLSNTDFDFNENFEKIQTFYIESKSDFGYLPYHEMRFCTILLIEAKRNKEPTDKIIFDYLQNLKEQNYLHINYEEVIIFLCNSLFWLEEFTMAYEIIKSEKQFFKKYSTNLSQQISFHYFGINMAFAKTTFALIYLANNDDNLKDFEITNADFNDCTDLLYRDFIRLMYVSKRILFENGMEHKRKLFSELKPLVEKTNYHRIYIILKNLDIYYPEYST